MTTPETTRDRAFGLGLAAVSVVGIVLRVIHLDIPMRYDESVTYLAYASQGWEHITSNYAQPNNHVLHSLMVHWLTTWFGDAPFVIRLPAITAGCALIPATGWAGRLLYGRDAGLMAAVLVATSPVLIEFSTNARGYTLLALSVVLAITAGSRILRDGWWIAWIGLIEVGVIGFYTLPVMLIPWLGLTFWLVIGLYRQPRTLRARVKGLSTLVAANLTIGLIVLSLYAGIISSGGLAAITANRFVEAIPIGSFALATPGAIGAILQHWSRGMPTFLVGVAAVSVAAGLVYGRGRHELMSLLVALTAGVTIVMLGIRNWGEPRIWLWALPILSMLAGVGMVQLSRQVARRNDILATALVACGWSGAMCIQMIVAQPVRASTETGVFPEVQEVVEGITERYRIDDIVTGDFVSVEPLRYYLQRWAASHEPPGRSAMERMWVILDSDEQERANNVRARVARAGAPPLSASTPAFTVGNVWVYLLGRSAHAPDDRLLRSVDWLTGVAGRVDDERAGALLSEVMADTDSPRARMWMARCLQLGCMAVEPDPGVAKRLADEAIQGILELAVAGDAEGSFLLGTAYELGLGQAVDSVQATASYRKAAEAGHVLAARLLAEAYFNGKGIGAGDTAAVTWWRRAADAGDATAQLRLGDAYRAGRGVERDLDQAESWYARAAERGLVRVVRF